MGWPVAHSRSPIIHNYWINEYGLYGTYEHIPVEPQNIGIAFNKLRSDDYAGCNITLPHKVDAIKYMDWVAPLLKESVPSTLLLCNQMALCMALIMMALATLKVCVKRALRGRQMPDQL